MCASTLLPPPPTDGRLTLPVVGVGDLDADAVPEGDVAHDLGFVLGVLVLIG